MKGVKYGAEMLVLAVPYLAYSTMERAVKPGEDSRAGRWWWESSEKECGLHLHRKTAT